MLNSINIDWTRIKAQGSSVLLWDLIKSSSSRDENGESVFKLLAKVFDVAHSLPTSSSCIEQTFSSLKLVKNSLRNSLNEETAQSLLVIAQEFKEKEITISSEILNLYYQLKEELNSVWERKSR